MTRPRIRIDYQRVQDLSAHGLSQAQICGVLGFSEDTLTRRKRDSAAVADALQKGRARGAAQVANKLFEKALAGDLGAIIWYEKTRCGRSDRLATESSGANGAPLKMYVGISPDDWDKPIVTALHAHELEASGKDSSPTR